MSINSVIVTLCSLTALHQEACKSSLKAANVQSGFAQYERNASRVLEEQLNKLINTKDPVLVGLTIGLKTIRDRTVRYQWSLQSNMKMSTSLGLNSLALGFSWRFQ